MSCIDDVFRSAINPPTSGNTFAAYVAAAKALGSNEPAVSCSFDQQAFHVLTHSLDYLQISDHGPVTGGVGAVATATPAATSANSSSATAIASSTPSSSSYSSAGHLVTDGLFSLLAVAFGITLA
jgi:phosphoribosylamine-glycine ligase